MATKPAADKKAAAPTENTAGAAALLCAMSGTTNGPVDDAVLGGVATDAGGIVSSSLGDDGAKVAGRAPWPWHGRRRGGRAPRRRRCRSQVVAPGASPRRVCYRRSRRRRKDGAHESHENTEPSSSRSHGSTYPARRSPKKSKRDPKKGVIQEKMTIENSRYGRLIIRAWGIYRGVHAWNAKILYFCMLYAM